MSKYLAEQVWLFDKQHASDTASEGNFEVGEWHQNAWILSKIAN